MSETSLCHQAWRLISDTSRNWARELKRGWLLSYGLREDRERMCSGHFIQYCFTEGISKLPRPEADKGNEELT